MESIAKPCQDVLVHQEDGAFIRFQHLFCRGVGSGPQAVHPHESAVAVGVENRPSADVERRGPRVVDLDPILGGFNGVVVAIRKDFRDGQRG